MAEKISDWNGFFKDRCGLGKKFFKLDSGGNINKGGVYMIDGLYVGESNNIRDRIKSHFNSAISGRHSNKKLSDYILDRLNTNHVFKIEILSDNVYDEDFFIRENFSKEIFNILGKYNG